VAAAAVGLQEGPGTKHLVGYVVAADGELDPAALRSFLSDELPHYMIPSRFVQLEQLPLTPVGKIDRAALPQATSDGGEGEQPEYVPPRTPTERRVAAVFARILERERVGAQDDFFRLGGTSLQAARAALELRWELGVELAVRDLYASPGVADVAHAIEYARAQ
jgi:acyl carrier protein